jgi:pyruvate dehydrogenase E1 component
MCADQENVFYYITVMNENYAHPVLPAGAEAGILRGMYELKQGGKGKSKGKSKGKTKARVQLLGSGTILREVLAAATLLEEKYGIPADVWSVTSFSELRREALDVERWNALHPGAKPRVSYVAERFAGRAGPFVAATDYMKLVSDQIRQWVPGRYVVLGTDGFGRSDGRDALRHHFEVDRKAVVVAALKALADEGSVDAGTVVKAMTDLGVDPEKPNPVTQ